MSTAIANHCVRWKTILNKHVLVLSRMFRAIVVIVFCDRRSVKKKGEMAQVDLIYCAAGNRRFADIARSYGFLYGAQLPGTVYGSMYFADQNWKNPVLGRYLAEIKQHRPYMASVLDWERRGQLPEIMFQSTPPVWRATALA